MAQGVLFYSAIVNILLGAFNLIPAFLLNGGRILRAGLVKWKKDYDQATEVAVKIGVWISYEFMGFGFLSTLSGSFTGGPWLVLIGWFLNNGAQSYLYQKEISSVLSAVRLEDIMNARVISVREGTKVDEL
jgi:Zn-dependent protease